MAPQRGRIYKKGGGYVARNDGAIVIEALLGEGDLLMNAKRLADAARSLDGATRRIGGQLRATAGGYISAVSKSVRAVETLRDEQLAAFGETAAAWERARSRLNGLSLALGELKRSARDAFVPIAAAAAPALIALTNLLARAASGVGSFMAALTGQNAFIRATGDQRAYAGSLRRTTGAARALERQLASFDELDILKEGRAGSGSGGGGSGALEALAGQISLFPADAGVVAFAQRLKKLFEEGNYDGVGRAIADGLNGAIEKARALIRWENVGASVTRVVDGFCDAFNGLVGGVRWTELGGALGDGIDTVLRGANRLLHGVNFARLGQGIGEGLTGAIREIDFDVLGDTLSRLLTAKLTVLANAALSFDWQALGGKLAQGLGSLVRTTGKILDDIDWSAAALSMTRGLNRFIARVDWSEIGAFLGGRISDALGALRTAVTEFDWGSAGTALSRAVNGLVKKIDWKALGQWLDRTIKGVLDFGIRFVEGFDADGFAKGIAGALDEVDWDGIAEKLWTLFSAALGKLGGFGKLLGQSVGGGPEAEVGVRLVKRGWTSIDGFVGTAVKVMTSLGKANWSSISDFVGTSVRVLTSLAKNGWTSLAGFVGERTTALVSLARSGWTSLAGFVGERTTAWVSLVRSGWTSLAGFVGDRTTALVSLVKSGWTSLAGFVGERTTAWVSLAKSGWTSLATFVGSALSVRTSLVKSGWTTLSTFVGAGSPTKVLVSLAKNGWTSIGSFVGTAVNVYTVLFKSGWSSISNFVGTSVNVWTQLARWGWSSIQSFVGSDVTVWTQLARWGWSSIAGFVGNSVDVWTSLRKNGWTSIADFVGTSVTTTVSLVVDKVSKISATIANALGLAGGGVITAGGNLLRFASGGAILSSGRASWWDGVSKYAAGTHNAHGTLFVAGEAGPEVAGHINGRTEILNKSQIAQAIFGAVFNGMVAAMRGITFQVPAVAAGAVVPYEVAAQAQRASADLRSALDANNEDLIQTIISVAGQIVSAIQERRRGGEEGRGGLSAQQLIDEINRRTQMYSASPIRGV